MRTLLGDALATLTFFYSTTIVISLMSALDSPLLSFYGEKVCDLIELGRPPLIGVAPGQY